MKAVQFALYGDPYVLELVEVADPEPESGQLLIRVRAIGVNPADGKWRSGSLRAMAELPLPHIGGYDVAGDVIGGYGLPLGTRVVAMVDPSVGGAYAEQVLTDSSRVAILPPELAYETGAALPTPGLTALQGIEAELAVQPGQRLLVTGAAGGVGRHAVAAARAAGARVVAAVRDKAQDEAIASGADEVVALDGRDYSGPPFDAALDSIGGAIVAPLMRAVRKDGLAVTAATAPIPGDGLKVPVRFFRVYPEAARLARVVAQVASGAATAPVAATLPLAEAAAAQARVAAGGTGGKIVLIP